jgi:pectate lyase
MSVLSRPRRVHVSRDLRLLVMGSGCFVFLTAGGCEPDLDSLTRGNGTGGVGGTAGGFVGNGGTTAGTASDGGSAVVGKGGRPSTGGLGGADAGGVGPEGGTTNAGAGGEPVLVGGAGGTGTTAGSAGQGSAGEGGAGGTFSGPCPTSTLLGWASVFGHNFDPLLDAVSGTDVTVTTAEELAQYAASPLPYVIHVAGVITIPALDVASDKTIVGADSSATINGGIRVRGTGTEASDMVSNVTIKNLHINALTADTSTEADDDDGITIAYAHHVWIDHVDVWDAGGDAIDVTHGSDYVTISWTKFRFVQAARRTGTRIGHSDANSAEDSGRLKVTLHHNYFTDSVDQRMPRVRFGDVHVFNNYFSHIDQNIAVNTYCVAAGLESRLVVENNFFDRVQSPHVFFSFVNGAAAYVEPSAQMAVAGNTYIGRSNDDAGKQSGQGDSFVPPYTVPLEGADKLLKDVVRYCAGPESSSELLER